MACCGRNSGSMKPTVRTAQSTVVGSTGNSQKTTQSAPAATPYTPKGTLVPVTPYVRK